MVTETNWGSKMVKEIFLAETKTFQDLKCLVMSRLWLFKTKTFKDVETETSRDWVKVVETETLLRVLLIAAYD